MIMKKTTLVLGLLMIMVIGLAAPVSAAWDKSDTALFALRIIDWGQTRDIATITPEQPILLPDGTQIGCIHAHYEHSEINPLLGEHPSRGKVNNYFVALIIFDQFCRHKADSNDKWAKFETGWQKVNIGIESTLVARNYSIGIDFKF